MWGSLIIYSPAINQVVVCDLKCPKFYGEKIEIHSISKGSLSQVLHLICLPQLIIAPVHTIVIGTGITQDV